MPLSSSPPAEDNNNNNDNNDMPRRDSSSTRRSPPTSSTTTATTTTNFYISTLAKELAAVCWQHITNTGNLATGGLGGWTWLQYKASFYCTTTTTSDGEERLTRLKAARDAAQEALHALHRMAGGSVGGGRGFDFDIHDDALCFDGNMMTMMMPEVNDVMQSKRLPLSGYPSSTSSWSTYSMSIYTNPFLGSHAMLAVILYQLGEGPAQVQHHVHNVLQYIRHSLQGLVLQQQQQKQQEQERQQDSRCDVWYGMAGAMQTIFFLRQQLQQETLGQALVIALARWILLEGKTVSRRLHREWMATRHNDPVGYTDDDIEYIINNNNSNNNPMSVTGLPLLWMYQGTVYLGGIHGVAGICSSLLGLSNDEWDLIEHHSAAMDVTQGYSFHGRDESLSLSNARQLVKQTVDGLHRYCFVSGNLRQTLDGTLNEVDKYYCWSHGAGGYVLLLLRSHEVFRDTTGTDTAQESDYLRRAQQLAENILWARRLTLTKRGGGGIGLTTGVAGVAYVFIRLAQVLMGDNRPREALLWKQRAEQLARHAVNHWRELLVLSSKTSQNPYSIMEGLGGLVALLFDLNSVDEAQFPFIYQPRTMSSINRNIWRTEQQEQYPEAPNPELRKRQPEYGEATDEQLTTSTKQPRRMIPKSPMGNGKPPSRVTMTPKSNLPNLKDTIKMSTSMQKSTPISSTTAPSAARFRADGIAIGKQYVPVDEAVAYVQQEQQSQLETVNLKTVSISDDGQQTPSTKRNIRDEKPGGSPPKIQPSNPIETEDKKYHRRKEEESIDGFLYDHSEDMKNPSLLDEEGHTRSSKVDGLEVYEEKATQGIAEFKSARPDDKPDQKYLSMQDSCEEVFVESTYLVKPLLDEEEHGTGSKKWGPHDEARGEVLDNDPDEFAESKDQDLPEESYLRKQDSSDDLYFEVETLEHYSVLDEERHSPPMHDATCRPRDDVKRTSSENEFNKQDSTMVAHSRPKSPVSADDEDEFHVSGDQAPPNVDYMRRQDSTDELYFDYSDTVNKNPILDDEDHVAQLSAIGQPEPLDDLFQNGNEAEEFQVADNNDQPDEGFLRMQASADHLSMSFTNGHHTGAAANTLDEDRHVSIGMDLLVRSLSGESLVEEFQETNEADKPDKRYLAKQDSQDELYFEYYTDQEKLALAKENIGQVAKEAAEVAAGSTFRSSKLRSKKSRIAKETPPRGDVTPATAATMAMTTTPHSSSPWQSANAKSDAAVLNWALVEACLKEADGEGNILNGGLGVSVYLRIKLSEIETETVATNEHLQRALKHALCAVEDALAEKSSKPYPSILSSDVVGAQCMLISLMNRLGRREDACRLADATLVKLVELYEIDTKHDCSIIFGLAGALQAIWFLRKELDDEEYGCDYVLTVSSAILMEGLNHQGKYQTDATLLWEWHDRPFLGAGTGATGVLYALLGHSEDEWMSLNECLPQAKEVIQQAIDSLGNLKHPSGNLMAAIDRVEEDRSTDWTHGAPGYCLLLLRAFEVFEDQKYLTRAKNLAENVIWPRRMQRRGLGLARGVSGVAYVFMALARVDTHNSDKWRSRAAKMAAMAVTDLEDLQALSKHPNSLFEGLGGLVSLLIDLERPTSDVYFPFFEHNHLMKDRHQIKTRTTALPVEVDGATDQRHDDTFWEYSEPTFQKNNNGQSCFTNQGSSEEPNKSCMGHAGGETTHANNGSRTTTTAPMSETSKLTASIRPNQQLYVTPPRRDGPKTVEAVSPITEPSSGITPARPVGSIRRSTAGTSKVSKSVQTKRIISLSKETQTKEDNDSNDDGIAIGGGKKLLPLIESTHDHRLQRTGTEKYNQSSSTKIWPPQVKRHIYTHAEDVPLAKRPTKSWMAKISQSMVEKDNGDDVHGVKYHDHDDAFTSNSIERLQRAEASWFKRKTMMIQNSTTATSSSTMNRDNYYDAAVSFTGGASVGSNGSNNFRKLVGGFEGC